MNTVSQFKQGVARIRRHWNAAAYDRALAEVDRLLQSWPDMPRLLVLRAELIQLSDESAPPLAEAQASLRRALDFDDQSLDALVEQGHFLLAVEDDANEASKSFAKAVTVGMRLLREALLGQAAALAELDRRQEAFDCLAQARLLQSQNGTSRKNGDEDLLTRWEELLASKP